MIHSICGLQNAGKTQMAVFFAFIDFLNGRKIISNIHLNFQHWRINKDFIYYLGKRQPILRNVSFLLDEAWIWFDCRNSMKGYKNMEQAIATYFFLQSSKDNSNIYLTAQDNSQNEIRVQRNLHRYSQCQRVQKTKEGFKPIEIEERDLTRFRTKEGICLNDLLFIESVNYKRKLSNIDLGSVSYKYSSTLRLRSKKYQRLYSTYEKRADI